MSLILKPAIALSNTLRFKTKFLLLAVMFYLPLLACFIWIVNDQASLLTQYEKELSGYEQIEQIVKLEVAIADSRAEPDSRPAIANKIKTVQQMLSSPAEFSQLQGQANDLYKAWQTEKENLTNASFDLYSTFYSQTLALRENVAALSGLTREGDAQAFYLAESSEQRLPALIEYTHRIKDLTALIISDGFSAETYTLVVSLDKRIDEFQLQLSKTNEQLQRIESSQLSSYNNQEKSLHANLDAYQMRLKEQMIDPDDITLSLSEANRLANDLVDQMVKFKRQGNKLLIDRIESLQTASTASLWLLSLVLIAVTIASSYLLIAIYRSLVINVNQVKHAAELLGAGDFTEQLNLSSKDELGDIGQSFNKMQSQIKQLLLSFGQDVTHLRSAANNIHQLTDEMQRSIGSQQQETHNVAAAIKQVRESVSTIADNTEGARQLTELASQSVNDGQDIIQDTAGAIGDISTEVNTSAVVINALAENSSEIAGFVDVIRKIADQTNLLALNAAIEAARAGEQGRGFAVVADEVRTLASRTQESTAEIQRIIEQLQEGATKSVTAMNHGVKKAQLGVEKTEQVEQTFHQVTNHVENIVAATIEISSAVTQQNEMVANIDENTINIAQGADQVMQAANNATTAGEALSTLADHLSEQLEQFVLEK